MVEHFFAELGAVSPLLPVLVRAMIVILVLIVTWIAFSIPGFWLCRTVGVFLNSSIDRLGTLRNYFFAKARELFRAISTPTERFISAHAQMFTFADENRDIIKHIERLRESVETLPKQLSSFEAAIVDAAQRFKDSIDALSHVELPQPAQPPGAATFNQIQTARNHAIITIAFSLLLTIPLLVFNTAMLEAFFDGLWPGLDFFGIPFSLLIAAGGSLFEVALGVMLVRLPNVAKPIILIAIALLGLMEFVLYAKLGQGLNGQGPNGNVLDAFFPGGAPAYVKNWFGVLGVVLVVCLTGCGHLLITSLLEISDRGIVGQWKAYLRGRQKQIQRINVGIANAQRQRGILDTALASVSQHFDITPASMKSGANVIETAKQNFLEEIERARRIRLEATRQADRGAMIRQLIECVLFAAMIVVALAVIAAVYGTLAAITPLSWLSPFWFGWIAAFAQAVFLLGAGNAAARVSSTVAYIEGSSETPSQFGVSRLSGIAILVTVLLGNALYLLRVPTAAGAMLVLLVAAANVFLFWCGTRLGMIGAAVFTLFYACSYALASATMWVLGIILGAVQLLCAAFRVCLIVLAYPYGLIFHRDPRATQLSATRSAA